MPGSHCVFVFSLPSFSLPLFTSSLAHTRDNKKSCKEAQRDSLLSRAQTTLQVFTFFSSVRKPDLRFCSEHTVHSSTRTLRQLHTGYSRKQRSSFSSLLIFLASDSFPHILMHYFLTDDATARKGAGGGNTCPSLTGNKREGWGNG